MQNVLILYTIAKELRVTRSIKGHYKGFHTKLTDDLLKTIIDSVEKGYVKNHIAAIAHIHPETFGKWLIRGKNESKEHSDSLFAQLYVQYCEKQALIAGKTVTEIRGRPKNYQALVWFLERVYRDEYGVDSEMIKELAANILKLAENKRTDNDEINGSKAQENPEE